MVTKNKLLKIKTYPRKSRRRQILSRSSKVSFLLNCHNSEREILNEEGQYLQWRFLTGFGLKMRDLPTKTNKITPTPPHFNMLEAHGSIFPCLGTYQMPQAHGNALPYPRRMHQCFRTQFLQSLSFLGLRLDQQNRKCTVLPKQ